MNKYCRYSISWSKGGSSNFETTAYQSRAQSFDVIAEKTVICYEYFVCLGGPWHYL